jgi:hypothetical protein
MQQHLSQRLKRSTFTTPMAIFLISLIGPASVLGLPLMLGWPPDYLSSRLYYFGTLGQALMDLPAIVMLARTRVDWLGRKPDRVLSIAVGVVGAATLAGAKLAVSGQLTFMGGIPAFTQSLTLAWPCNLIAATSAVLVYGPGEALYIVYFVIAFDATTASQHRLLSRGVVITAFLWGLSHSWNVFFFGWAALGNALFMVMIGLAIGLLYKRSRSAAGPMVFWSLVNGTSA